MEKEQAIEMAKSAWWKNKSAKEIVDFHLYEKLLCMPFSEYHKAIEDTLGRPVLTHEFAFLDDLKKEYEGKKSKPSFDEICALIPKDKLDVVV